MALDVKPMDLKLGTVEISAHQIRLGSLHLIEAPCKHPNLFLRPVLLLSSSCKSSSDCILGTVVLDCVENQALFRKNEQVRGLGYFWDPEVCTFLDG